ncbi:hypothetical protein QYE76_033607 [Lolium multiflorum]|uniref:AAR2 C-terminal domain-containing protein n=1 Tax=Lolium multiflorum TaxID=4521 RepID=A0AAD8VKG1_LOLMU|nr:hypothetical protein QYE76_033607 [Lolium multiflorum]
MASSGGGAARMDPDAATELARKGVTLLLLDVPKHTVLGVDTQTSLLETVLAKNYQGQEDLLLGELQFSFIAFMVRKLKTLVETTFAWDLKNSAASLVDEDDEFALVVVETDGS